MNNVKNLTPERIQEIKSRGIDYSDIPKFTKEELLEFRPKNVQESFSLASNINKDRF